ncbi:SCO6745 family protein [Amycolatopsis bartoniae]|uniref:SCO6745 family protein n=1 Tax=Amycolatopsis bartoniae TaxID=941986 RepID=UPI0036F46508
MWEGTGVESEEARALAHRCHRVLDPLHSMIYFAPEAEELLSGLGLRRGRMAYFASRSAPMGPVSAGTVAATFYNFNPALVAKHIPLAWTLASPAQIVETRFAVADAVMRRLLGEAVSSDETAEAASLAREASEACTGDGRPLYAAHAELAWPSEPHVVLWHAITLLREYRGDGHIAALVGHGVSGLGALITHTATGKGFLPSAAKATRGWSDEEWDAESDHLKAEGVLDADGALTEQGLALRESIETQTNASAVAPWRRLGADRAARLHELGRTLSRAAVAAGAFPSGVFAAPRA